MKKLLLIGLLVAGAWFAWTEHDQTNSPSPLNEQTASRSRDTFEAPRSGEQIRGSGTVVRILADDNDGSRHQRFILGVAGGRTLLVAHNIDIAPRVAELKTGDAVEFYGEYEWNDKGGVIHWTHHDPNGRHVGGWLKHGGRTYQ
jgi:Protein of unknown function (DUF3465)